MERKEKSIKYTYVLTWHVTPARHRVKRIAANLARMCTTLKTPSRCQKVSLAKWYVPILYSFRVSVTFADIARMSADTFRDTALVSINTIMVLSKGRVLRWHQYWQAEVSNERRSLMKRHLHLHLQECTAVSNNTDTRKVSLNTRIYFQCSFNQRSVSQENTFKKSKNLLLFFAKL